MNRYIDNIDNRVLELTPSIFGENIREYNKIIGFLLSNVNDNKTKLDLILKLISVRPNLLLMQEAFNDIWDNETRGIILLESIIYAPDGSLQTATLYIFLPTNTENRNYIIPLDKEFLKKFILDKIVRIGIFVDIEFKDVADYLTILDSLGSNVITTSTGSFSLLIKKV